jgi:hypothetical protein
LDSASNGSYGGGLEDLCPLKCGRMGMSRQRAEPSLNCADPTADMLANEAPAQRAGSTSRSAQDSVPNRVQPRSQSIVVGLKDRSEPGDEDVESESSANFGQETAGARVPERMGRSARGSWAQAVRRSSLCFAPNSRWARASAPRAGDPAREAGLALAAWPERVRGVARSDRGRLRARGISVGALQRAVQSPAPDRGRRLQDLSISRIAGACSADGSLSEPAVEALRKGLRGSLPRSHPALADGGVECAALRAVQRASTGPGPRARAPIRCPPRLGSMDGARSFPRLQSLLPRQGRARGC